MQRTWAAQFESFEAPAQDFRAQRTRKKSFEQRFEVKTRSSSDDR